MAISPIFWFILKAWGISIILGLLILWYYHGRHKVIIDVREMLFDNGIVGFLLGLGTIAVGAPLVLIISSFNTIFSIAEKIKEYFINQNTNKHDKSCEHEEKGS